MMRVPTCVHARTWYPDVFIESKRTVHRRKEISSNRPAFVCFSPSVLPYPHSLYLAKRPSAAFLFISFKRSAGPPIFPLSSRPASDHYYPIAIFLARSLLHFSRNRLAPARTGQSPKCWRGQSSEIPARYVSLLHLQSKILARRWN